MEIISEEKVRHYLLQENESEVKVRLIALNLVGRCEMSVSEAAEATMIPVKTISEWIRAWNREGYGGINDRLSKLCQCQEPEEEFFVSCSYL